MLLALDVHYKNSIAKVVGIFYDWSDNEAQKIIIDYVNDIEDPDCADINKYDINDSADF